MAIRASGARVAGDIGCYTLAISIRCARSTPVAMGSSIGNAIGMAKAGTRTKPIVATIGDSTFLHAGIPPLIDAVYNEANIIVLILDNHMTAMTGGQHHPGTGRTLRGEASHGRFRAAGAGLRGEMGAPVDFYDVGEMHQAFREAAAFKGVSVVISDRPCVLDPVRIKGPEFAVALEFCTACQSCMNLGCPALGWDEATFEGRHKVRIDAGLCIGCSLCAQVCPSDCIRPVATAA